MVKVLVKWGKEKYEVELDTAGSVADFKALLLSLTGVWLWLRVLAKRWTDILCVRVVYA